MHGIGIDLLEIERLERAIARRPGLAERLFTNGERAYAARRARPAQHLAARFCAKEAVAKALALDVLRWQEIEVTGEGGAPRIQLHGATATAAAASGEVRVSLTHTDRTAGAVAVVG
jgi:holo-[acyl-carrier protein] synthase